MANIKTAQIDSVWLAVLFRVLERGGQSELQRLSLCVIWALLARPPLFSSSGTDCPDNPILQRGHHVGTESKFEFEAQTRCGLERSHAPR